MVDHKVKKAFILRQPAPMRPPEVLQAPKATWKSIMASIMLLTCTGMGHAAQERAGFYTIVGPDGQLIVIDRNAAAKPKDNSTSKREKKKESAAGSHLHWPLFGKHKQPVAKAAEVASSSGQSAAEKPTADTPEAMPDDPVTAKHLSASTQDNSSLPSVAKNNLTDKNAIPNKNVNLDKKTIREQNNIAENSTDQPAAPVPAQSASVESVASAQSEPVTVIDGEKYIDSEYLEQREFNLEGKKRFYNLPNGLGGREVLEREKGVDMTAFRKTTVQKPQVVDLAKNYQRIPKEQVIALTGTSCFSPKQLKAAKLFKADEYLDFWPRPGFEPRFDFVVAKLAQPINDILVTSYASSMAAPKFYWPLPIFLDEQGCVMEGVNAFYQTTLAPNVTTHQAIQGYLHIPPHTRYILFTPLEAAADLSDTPLTDKGQVRLTPIR